MSVADPTTFCVTVDFIPGMFPSNESSMSSLMVKLFTVSVIFFVVGDSDDLCLLAYRLILQLIG